MLPPPTRALIAAVLVLLVVGDGVVPTGAAASPVAGPPAAAAPESSLPPGDYTYASLHRPVESITLGDDAGLIALVEPGGRRVVRLQERVRGTWRTVALSRTGRYEAPVDLAWTPQRAGAHLLRVVAPRPARRPRLERVVSAVQRVYGSVEGAPTFRSSRAYLPNAARGMPYADQQRAYSTSSDDDGLTWSLARGRLPAGLSLGTDGLIAGAASGPAGPSRHLVLRVVDRAGRRAWIQQWLRVRPTPAPALTSDLADPRAGQAWVDRVRTNGARVGTWTVRRGALPDGLTLERRTGIVSGTPAAGTSSFRLHFREVTGRVAVRDQVVTTVDGGGTPWTSLRSDGSTTCGIQADSSGWCWGANPDGSVGDGTRLPRLHPYRLPGSWTWLESRLGTTCGIRISGSAWCWGSNGLGTVGDGSGRSSVPTPTRLPGTWAELGFHGEARAFATICGLRTDASLWCWGYDRYAQSGDGRGGRDDVRTTPYEISGTWQGVPVGTGDTRCAIDTDDRAWCWGANQTGQIGNGQTGGIYGGAPPTPLPGTWTSVVTGGASGPYSGTTCGVQTDGTGWCWGENGEGEIGDGTREDALSPVQLPGSWASISPPAELGTPTCGLRPGGTAACWGYNYDGAVGDGTTESRLTPAELPGTWAMVRSSGQTTCGLGLDGSGWCWGSNHEGAVGNGDYVDRLTPYELEGTWESLGVQTSWGGATVCGVRTDGSGWCWGDARAGRTGTGAVDDPPRSADPVRVPTRLPGTWASIDRTRPFSTICGIATAGAGWCWGFGERGSVGNGVLLDQAVPYGVVGGVVPGTP